ncbi:MAG: MgtC/SapB family protein [Planctomycetes bacterium]|nr:MgtC/SapB family protein [Planctomycetota bacterium]
MNDLDLGLARDFGTALLIGVLIGIDREQQKGARGIGLRSFALLALLGAGAGFLDASSGSSWLLPTVLLGVVAIVATAYVADARRATKRVGITTELAAIATCVLGALVTTGHVELGVGLGVTTAALLAYKEPMHALAGKLGRAEVLAGLRFLLATFIVLPLLPDRAIDPWDAVNPHRLWLLVLLISGLSLIGYVAGRWLGPRRGILLTAVTGGLVSSTAVTLALARQSRDRGAPTRHLAAGALLAWAVMWLRVVVLTAIVGAVVTPRVWLPCAAMAAACAIVAAVYLRLGPHDDAEASEVPLKNPFSLWAATQVGLLFAVVQLLMALAQDYMPTAGSYTVAVLAGTTDVDAVALSMAGRAREELAEPHVAAVATMLAGFSNTLAKAIVASVVGRGLTRWVLVPGIASIAVGALLLWTT